MAGNPFRRPGAPASASAPAPAATSTATAAAAAVATAPGPGGGAVREAAVELSVDTSDCKTDMIVSSNFSKDGSVLTKP